MSIKVVCDCGFATLVPSAWQGRRVRCKCGRSFIVGPAGAITDPPPATDPQAGAPPAASETPPSAPEPPVAGPAAPLPPSAGPVAPEPAPLPVAEVIYRERRTARPRRHRHVLAGLLLVTALTMASAAAYVLHLHDWSLAALLQPAPDQHASKVADAAAAGTGTVGGESTEQPPGPSEDGTAPAAESAATRLANLMPLVPEDGLLLTGLFGDAAEHLALTDEQREAIAALVAELQAGEEPLRAKSMPLDQWYAETRRLGDQLLAVLTDVQRQELQVLLRRGPAERVQLVEYAAQIRPELGVPEVPWSLPTDSRSYQVPSVTRLTHLTGHVCGRTLDPTGLLVTHSRAGAGDGQAGVWVWNLSSAEPLGRLDLESTDIVPPCLLSPDGAYVAVTRTGQGSGPMVEVWETASGRQVGDCALPAAADDPAAVCCCTDRVVIATTRHSCWVWEFHADRQHAFDYPEGRPEIAPGLVVSPQGKYVTVAHRHAVGDAPATKYFLEVCVYDVDSGELLGNQVLQQDYRRSTVSAMALSPDGRELALVWDFDDPAPARRLVHMLATNGKVLRVVDGLRPPLADGAAPRPLPDRELICLPENSGWVVDLRQVVDAETGAVLELDGAADQDALTRAAGSDGVGVEVLPTDDGRLLLVTAHPEDTASDSWSLQVQSVDLPRLGPFQ